MDDCFRGFFIGIDFLRETAFLYIFMHFMANSYLVVTYYSSEISGLRRKRSRHGKLPHVAVLAGLEILLRL